MANENGMNKTFGVRGKILHSQAREIVANVMKFMKEEADNQKSGVPGVPLENYKQRVLKATGISTKLYRTIGAESKAAVPGKKKFSTPKKHKAVSRKTVLPQGAEMIIRDIICNFYITEKQRPHLKGILEKVREAQVGFEGGKSTLWVLLQKMGFKFRKCCADNRKALVESHDVRLKRIEYLRAIRQFREEKRPIIYSDETYVYSSHAQPNDCTDSTGKASKELIKKDKRLIIIHAGGEMGFVPNGLLIFPANKSGDCHEKMTLVKHENWLVTQIIPNLPPRSVFVVDNAFYHNVKLEKEPASTDRKADMISWLQKQGIAHDPAATKPELYKIIKAHKNRNPVYRMDAMFQQHGHTVLRLPPYTPELNPIEKIWNQVKDFVASHNVTFNLSDVQKLAEKKFREITEVDWAAICDYVKENENRYFSNENMLDEAIDQLTFTVKTGSCSDSDSDSDSNYSTKSCDLSSFELLSD